MKRKILTVLAAAMTALAMNVAARALSIDDLAAGMKAAAGAPPKPVAARAAVKQAAARPVEREWLVLVFVNGRNNLWPAAIKDVNEMELAGSTDKVAVTVEMGLLQDRGASSRFYIRKDTAPAAADLEGPIVSPAIKVPGADMGSWKHFAEFAAWSYKKYPARKVLAIIWGHGFGRLELGGADNSGSELGIATDDLTRNFIRNKQLAMALREIEKSTGRKVSVYASDSCIMQMASVVYEIKDGAELVVGAEERVPEAGFPYGAILRRLASEPGMSPEALGAAMVNEFSASYAASGRNTTLSAIRTSALPEFVRLLNDWVREAAVPANRKLILEAEFATLSFENGYDGNDTTTHARSKDLYDFVNLAGKKAGRTPQLYIKGEALKDFIAKVLVASNRITTSGPKDDYTRARGLAAYFPRMIYDSSYDETLFARDSLWDDFLKWKLDPSYRIR